MPRGKSETHALQRDTILNTAADTFAEVGYASATMQMIAQRCGVSKSLLYHYYTAKDAILFDLLDHYTRRLLDILESVGKLDIGAREQLFEMIRRFVFEYEHSRSRHTVLLRDVRFLPTPQANIVLDAQRKMVTIYARNIATSEGVSLARGKALAMALFGMINWTFTWLRPAGELSYATFAETVVAFMRGGLTPAAGMLKLADATPSHTSLSRSKKS
jgi:AcrR family transcriptional regulator